MQNVFDTSAHPLAPGERVVPTKLLLFAVLVLGLPAVAFEPQELEAFMARRRALAAALTDQQLTQLSVFMAVSLKEGAAGAPAVLRGLRDAGYLGAIAASKHGETAKTLAAAHQLAAKKSGLTVADGFDMWGLVNHYYWAVYGAAQGDKEVKRARAREQFAKDFGDAKADLLRKHEAEFMPVLELWMTQTRAQARDAGF